MPITQPRKSAVPPPLITLIRPVPAIGWILLRDWKPILDGFFGISWGFPYAL